MAIAPHTQNRQANLPLGSLQHKQILNEINYHTALYPQNFTNLGGQRLEINKEKQESSSYKLPVLLRFITMN